MPVLITKRDPQKDPSSHVDEVVKNGLEFIERGVRNLWDRRDKHHLKHSVINFYAGVELLLKTRLMREHWALIVEDINQADASKFIEGDFRSVGLESTLKRLSKIPMENIPASARDSFNVLRQHRNRMVHFFHSVDLRTKEGKALEGQIVREQCRGWFHLRRLVGDKWSAYFANYMERIGRINDGMKRHKLYLDTVYEQVKPELDKEQSQGSLVGQCFTCGYPAHLVEESGPNDTSCRVCRATQTFVRHGCSSCNEPFIVEDGCETQACPNCGNAVSLEELLEFYTEEGKMTEKDLHTLGGYAYCAECDSGLQSVGSIGDLDGPAFCFFCHSSHESIGECARCGTRATGDLEDSAIWGCLMCSHSVP